MAEAARKPHEETTPAAQSGVRNAQVIRRTANNDALIPRSDASKKVYPSNTRNAKVFQSSVPTDEAFSASYAKKGLQPRGLADFDAPKPPTDDRAVGAVGAPDITRAAAASYATRPQRRTQTTTEETTPTKQINLIRKKGKVSKKVRGRAHIATGFVMSIGFGLWIFMAFLSFMALTFFGAAMVLDAANTAIENAQVNDEGKLNLFGKGVKFTGDVFKAINSFGTEYIGIDAQEVLSRFTNSLPGPTDGFAAFHTLTFMFGFVLLMLFVLIYIVFRLRPLFGSKAGLKIGTFLLALIAYGIPLVNLFPWFVPWAVVVWRNPR